MGALNSFSSQPSLAQRAAIPNFGAPYTALGRAPLEQTIWGVLTGTKKCVFSSLLTQDNKPKRWGPEDHRAPSRCNANEKLPVPPLMATLPAHKTGTALIV